VVRERALVQQEPGKNEGRGLPRQVGEACTWRPCYRKNRKKFGKNKRWKKDEFCKRAEKRFSATGRGMRKRQEEGAKKGKRRRMVPARSPVGNSRESGLNGKRGGPVKKLSMRPKWTKEGGAQQGVGETSILGKSQDLF